MKLKQKTYTALEILAGACSVKSASLITGTSETTLKNQAAMMRRNAHLAFGPPTLDIAISTIAAAKKINVVQVGANDGRTGDPAHHLIRRYAAKALLIEPQTSPAEKITKSYEGFEGELIVERSAISNSGDSVNLFQIKAEHVTEYNTSGSLDSSQLASCDRDYLVEKLVEKMKISPELASRYVEEVTYPATTLSAIAQKHSFEEIDFLQVDCEGYDLDVIASLKNIRPSIINFEVAHFSSAQRSAWKTWANEHNYGFIQGPRDCIAILNAPFALEWK